MTEPKIGTTFMELDPDGIDHPEHYNMHPSGIECIDIVRWHSFNVGNAIKYLWREGIKSQDLPDKDLKKAIWYLENELERRESIRDEAEVREAEQKKEEEEGNPAIALVGEMASIFNTLAGMVPAMMAGETYPGRDGG